MADYNPAQDTIDTASGASIASYSLLGIDSSQTGDNQFVRLSASSLKTMFQEGLIASQIPSLDASKITTGTLAAARIPDLSTTYQPLDADLTSIAALTTTTYGRSLLTIADAAALRTSAGLVIGTDVQAYDSDLASIAALTTTTYGRSLLTLADAAALRTSAGLVVGTDVQAFDSDLASIAALTTTTFGRSLLTQADAAALRTTAGLVIGTNVQAYDSDLDSIAALSTTSYGRNLLTLANATALRSAVSSGSGVTFSNADFTITAGATYVAQTGTLSAARVVTLPAASSYNRGDKLTIADESGTLTYAYPISIVPAGTDTLNGVSNSTTVLALDVPYQRATLVSNGTNAWFVDSVTPTHSVQVRANSTGNIALGQMEAQSSAYDIGAITSGTAFFVVGIDNDGFSTTRLDFGSTAASYALISLLYRPGSFTYKNTSSIQLEVTAKSAVPTATTNEFISIIGFSSLSTGEPSEGVYFLYNINEATSATNWVAVTSNGGTRTKTNTGVAAGNASLFSAAYQKFVIDWAGSTVRFFINGVLVATHTTNIPNNPSTSPSPMCGIARTVGTASASELFMWRKARICLRQTGSRIQL